MLEPQPDPIPGGPSVTDWVLAQLAAAGVDPIVAELVRIRREQGIARYGTELTAHNGRDVRCERVQEAVDLLLYGGQESMERGDSDLDELFDARLVDEITALARELEAE